MHQLEDRSIRTELFKIGEEQKHNGCPQHVLQICVPFVSRLLKELQPHTQIHEALTSFLGEMSEMK
jgi:hypothetical protein